MNDRLRMRFEVLTVVGAADIEVVLLDVSGRRRATIFEHQGGNGTYTGAGASTGRAATTGEIRCPPGSTWCN